MMDRRTFLRRVTTGAAAAVAGTMLDPERLLWVPGAKTIFLPNPTIVTAKTIEQAVEEGLMVRYPDGTVWTMRGDMGLYGGYEALVKGVRREGGVIVPSREWLAHDVDGKASWLQPSVPSPAGPKRGISLRMIKEWELAPSPLTVGAGQTGRSITTGGWSVPTDDDREEG